MNIVLGLLIVLAGCAMAPRYTNTNADVGARPEPSEEAIREHLRVTLLDPNSVQDFRVSAPERASCMIAPGDPLYGWRVMATDHAKNAYGGHTGLRPSASWFHGERITWVTADATRCPEGW